MFDHFTSVSCEFSQQIKRRLWSGKGGYRDFTQWIDHAEHGRANLTKVLNGKTMVNHVFSSEIYDFLKISLTANSKFLLHERKNENTTSADTDHQLL
jgi:hypothetical protein